MVVIEQANQEGLSLSKGGGSMFHASTQVRSDVECRTSMKRSSVYERRMYGAWNWRCAKSSGNTCAPAAEVAWQRQRSIKGGGLLTHTHTHTRTHTRTHTHTHTQLSRLTLLTAADDMPCATRRALACRQCACRTFASRERSSSSAFLRCRYRLLLMRPWCFLRSSLCSSRPPCAAAVRSCSRPNSDSHGESEAVLPPPSGCCCCCCCCCGYIWCWNGWLPLLLGWLACGGGMSAEGTCGCSCGCGGANAPVSTCSRGLWPSSTGAGGCEWCC